MQNKFSINILHNNFNILRKSKHLGKGEFCQLMGVTNAFRTDYSSIGPKIMRGITDNFPGITEEWLLTSHDVKDELLKFADQQTRRIIAESDTVYNHTPPKDSDLLIKTAQILESNSVYRNALKSNIEAFHYAITCEEKLTLANKRIDNLEEQILEIKDRLPAVGES